jgi:hypothetical protein
MRHSRERALHKMGLIFSIIEGLASAWGWVKTTTAEKLGMNEQKSADLAKQNQSLEKQLNDAVNSQSAADKLRDGKF